MRWSTRQRAMLDAMGLWVPAEVPASGADPNATPLAMADRAVPPADPPMQQRTTSIESSPCVVGTEPSAPHAESTPSVATMDWPALRAAVSSCTACGLCRSRTQTVFGSGHLRARWMIIGEAPGEQEDLRGEPFVGKSGQLLDSMLSAAGLSRNAGPPERQVFIANTLKCRPPANRNPEPEELSRCEPFLVRQIELVKPSVVLAMGRFAVQALLRSAEPIGRLRGRVHRYQGVPLVVTYHPAYLLRNPRDKARAWEDLCLAMTQVFPDELR